MEAEVVQSFVAEELTERGLGLGVQVTGLAVKDVKDLHHLSTIRWAYKNVMVPSRHA